MEVNDPDSLFDVSPKLMVRRTQIMKLGEENIDLLFHIIHYDDSFIFINQFYLSIFCSEMSLQKMTSNQLKCSLSAFPNQKDSLTC